MLEFNVNYEEASLTIDLDELAEDRTEGIRFYNDLSNPTKLVEIKLIGLEGATSYNWQSRTVLVGRHKPDLVIHTDKELRFNSDSFVNFSNVRIQRIAALTDTTAIAAITGDVVDIKHHPLIPPAQSSIALTSHTTEIIVDQSLREFGELQESLSDRTDTILKLNKLNVLLNEDSQKFKLSPMGFESIKSIISSDSTDKATKQLAVKTLCSLNVKPYGLLNWLENVASSDDELIKLDIVKLFARNPDYRINDIRVVEKMLTNPKLEVFALAILKDAVNNHHCLLSLTTIEHLVKSLQIKAESRNILVARCSAFILALASKNNQYWDDLEQLINIIKVQTDEVVNSNIYHCLNIVTTYGVNVSTDLLKIIDESSPLYQSNPEIIVHYLGIYSNLISKGHLQATEKIIEVIGKILISDENSKLVGAVCNLFLNILKTDGAHTAKIKEYLLYVIKNKSFKEQEVVIALLTDLGKLTQIAEDEELTDLVKKYVGDKTPLTSIKIYDKAKLTLEWWQCKNFVGLETSSLPIIVPTDITSSSYKVFEDETDHVEKSPRTLIDEIWELNNGLKIGELAGSGALFTKFEEANEAFLKDSIFAPQKLAINLWDLKNVNDWSQKFRIGKCWQEDGAISEMIAVVNQANKLHTGHSLRATQILSLLIFTANEERGLLAQIKTGEGKSTTCAALAAIKALRGETVDIITSSSVLAERDASERKDFFRMFGISVSHNCLQQKSSGFKECYASNIVYGDISNFQYDILRHEYKMAGTRGSRGFGCVIVDEVDSMLIDESAKIAMLASPVPGSEYLEALFASLWGEMIRVSERIIYDDKTGGYVYVQGPFSKQSGNITLLSETGNIFEIDDIAHFKHEHLEHYLRQIIATEIVPIPAHLIDFASTQVESWVRSCIMAVGLKEKQDYLVVKDEERNHIISPVDYSNTGLIQAKSSWSNGLHQFLQIKHGLKITAENLTTSFVSNLGYLKRYGGKIYGMTGTIGSHDAQELLTHVYPVDLAFIPTYKTKHFKELPAILSIDRESWMTDISKSVKDQAVNNRAVLVICETIRNVELVRENLLLSGYPKDKVMIYSRNDNQEEYEAITQVVSSGDVILATNLAGRGTDIKTSKIVEESGGLHVCLTFLPSNLRVEEQAFGRTSRQGNEGSAQLVINQPDIDSLLGLNSKESGAISYYKDFRDNLEKERLNNVKLYEADRIVLEDLLFGRFCKFVNKLRLVENNKAKLDQLEENWGVALKEITQNIIKEAQNHLKSKINSYGLKYKDSGLKFNNVFQAISQQLNYEITSTQLQKKVALYLIDNDSGAKDAETPLEDEILKIASIILGKNIIVFDSEKLDPQIYKYHPTNKFIYLGAETNSLTPLINYKPLTLLSERELNPLLVKIIEKAEIHEEITFLKSKEDSSVKDKVSKLIDSWKKLELAKASAHNEVLKKLALEKFELFTKKMYEQYVSDHQIMRNPAYLVQKGFNSMGVGNRYDEAAKLLKMACNLDDNFSMAAHYNYAYAIIRGKIGNYKQDAYTELMIAKAQIEGVLIPNLEVMQVSAVKNPDSLLAKQIINKIELLKLQVEYIDKSAEKIKQSKAKNAIEISQSKLLRDFFGGDSPELEIRELNHFGIHQLFDVEEITPPDNVWGTVFMAIAGIVQIGIGVLCAMSGNVSMGASLIVDGFRDCLSASAAGKGDFDWKGYFTAKGINIAVQLCSIGSKGALNKLGVKFGGTEATKELVKHGSEELIKETLKEIGKKVLVGAAIDKIANKGTKIVLSEFNDKLRDHVAQSVREILETDSAGFKRLLMIDNFNGNNNHLNSIVKSGFEALRSKQSIIATIASQTMSQVSGTMLKDSSNIATKIIGAAGHLTKVASIGSSMTKISEVTSKVQDKIHSKISSLNGSAPDLAGLLEQKLQPLIDRSIALELISSLEKSGVIVSSQISKQVSADSIEIPEKYSLMKKRLADVVNKLHKAQTIEYEKTRELVASNLSSHISSTMLGMVRSEVVMSAASPYLGKLTEKVTDTLASTAEEFIHKFSSKSKYEQHIRETEKAIAKKTLEERDHQVALGVAAGDVTADDDDEPTSGTKEKKPSKEASKEEMEQEVAEIEELGERAKDLTPAVSRGELSGFSTDTSSNLVGEVGVVGSGSSKGKIGDVTSIETINARKYEYYIGDIETTASMLGRSDQQLVGKAIEQYKEVLKRGDSGDFPSIMHGIMKRNMISLEDRPGLKYLIESAKDSWTKASSHSAASLQRFYGSLPPTPSGSPSSVSFINSAYASSATLPLGVATPLDLSLTTDIAITGGLLRSTGALARGIPAAASITGTAIVYDRAMRPVTEFESKHQWVDGDFNEMLDNPTIPKTDKDKMVRSMMGDPLLRSTSTTSLSTGINLNQLTLSQTLSTLTPAPKLSASSASSSSLGPVSVSPYITIDSKINRPLIETFPIVDDRPHDFVTEIPDRDLARFKPTGFDPVDKDKLPSSREEFPDHSELASSARILEKTRADQEDFNECEKSESPIWKGLEYYKTINGKATRTNGLTGKDTRYYQWDDLHKEVEVYNRHGKPIDVIDPVNGKTKGKSVDSHRDLRL